ncbi:hypothetical protein ACRYCC_35265 [Actinomadura scrupuli]|uniref:hypothetical protein n=1 Tax=Actinomadura scrupuli TaxID=559629 RepID=UPI003D990883
MRRRTIDVCYESYIRDRQEQAHQARGDAEAHLITRLDNGEALTVAVAAITRSFYQDTAHLDAITARRTS